MQVMPCERDKFIFVSRKKKSSFLSSWREWLVHYDVVLVDTSRVAAGIS
jgi:hypothetical protein